MTPQHQHQSTESKWQGLYKAGGIATTVMLALIPVQIVIYIVWPPPGTVQGFFELFQNNWLLGLLSMDVLYVLNNTLLGIIYLALYIVLKRANQSLALIALALGFLGITAYFPSNISFEMFSLSNGFAAATTQLEKSTFLAAGEGMLAIYTGTSFNVYYVLNAVALLMVAWIMLRSDLFSKATAYWGLASGGLMSIPSSAGAIGMVFALASLAPWVVFCVLIARRFFQLARLAAG